MKDMLFIEDTKEGIFLTYRSSNRRILKVLDSQTKEQDAKEVIHRFNRSLARDRFTDEAVLWLKEFVRRHSDNQYLDTFTKATATLLRDMGIDANA